MQDNTVIDGAPAAAVPATVKASVPAQAAEHMINPFAVFRQRNSSGGVLFRGDLIKCDHANGEWLRMKGEKATLIGHDERFVVNPLEMIDTWTKFIGGKFIERKTYRTVDFEYAPVREALGDMDEGFWEWERNGRKRKDPWSRGLFLPMKALGDGEVCCFKATGAGAIGEIAELCAMYANGERNGMLPVITPDARSFDSSHGSTIFVPAFRLVGWEFWDGGTPTPPVPLRPAAAISLPAKPATPSIAKPVKSAAPLRDDMDDLSDIDENRF